MDLPGNKHERGQRLIDAFVKDCNGDTGIIEDEIRLESAIYVSTEILGSTENLDDIIEVVFKLGYEVMSLARGDESIIYFVIINGSYYYFVGDIGDAYRKIKECVDYCTEAYL